MKKTTSYHRFYAILRDHYKFATRELGDDFKAGVVSQFTDSRTTHLHEMTQEEYDRMCDHLENMTLHLKRTLREELRHQRSITLHLMQQMGIDTTDWERINAFCRDPRIMGKDFRAISTKEHKALQRKLRAIARNGGIKRRPKPKTEKKSKAPHPLNWVGTLIVELEADPNTLS